MIRLLFVHNENNQYSVQIKSHKNKTTLQFWASNEELRDQIVLVFCVCETIIIQIVWPSVPKDMPSRLKLGVKQRAPKYQMSAGELQLRSRNTQL